MSKIEALEKIKKLVEKYEAERIAGKLSKYSEEETKKGFIEPLFAALGWNITDKNEVTAEETISNDRVDYGFYLNDRVKFYLEAKKLSADLHREEYAKQTIRYSWNKGTTWAILTDFESLIVFNALSPEKSLAGKRYFEIPYREYADRFDQLWLLSKEAFSTDSIDKEAEKGGKKLQKVLVTEKLAQDLNYCRQELTEAFTQWNKDKNISEHLIDEGVQKLLNRLVFIRVAEDRKIEPPTLIPLLHQWKSSGRTGQSSPYHAMTAKFRELDKIYNSNLFDEHPFEKWEEFSGATEKVINRLYGDKNYFEYDFSVIPADVLGAVYENYLGYKMQQTKRDLFGNERGLAKDKRKRKEQGIYYTPHFIVDYIVKNVVGPVLDKCQSINDLQKVKILDPACGSGSFLVAAMDLIIKKYEDFSAKPDIFLKAKILQNNIYGVDLDEQAVEITRLNLLLNTFDAQIKLPNLGNNIKNGNSLISGTDEELKKYFGENYRDKKPFNWQEEFPGVFKQGGFDCVIGNPPYVNLANIKDKGEREWLKDKYETAKNKSDLYSFFTERAIKLLKVSSDLGFIFSNSWLGTDSFSKFREYLIKNTVIFQMVKLPSGVFKEALVTTVLIFLKNQKPNANHSFKLLECVGDRMVDIGELSYEKIKNNPGYNISFEKTINIRVPCVELGKVAKLSMGIKTSDNSRFILDSKEKEDCFPLLRGKDVGRYSINYGGKWIWYRPELMMEKVGAGPRKKEYFQISKLLFREITGGGIIATFDDQNYFTNNKIHVLYEIKVYNLKFVLALVNSKFINFWLNTNFNNSFQVEINQLEKIPIVKINFKDSKVVVVHDELVRLADKMLNLNKSLQSAPENSDQWRRLKDEITKTDKKIDEEVYKLYGLTEEEIKIVEGHLS